MDGSISLAWGLFPVVLQSQLSPVARSWHPTWPHAKDDTSYDNNKCSYEHAAINDAAPEMVPH